MQSTTDEYYSYIYTEILDVTRPESNVSFMSTTEIPDSGGPTSYYDVVRQIKFYMLAIIIPVGIVTNSLALSVFFNSALRKQTTGHYLISLAFADTFLLCGELLLWINTERIRGEPPLGSFMMKHDFWCKLIMYMRYAGRIWSSWVTVIITVERYIIVAFPLKVILISTTIKAKIVIVIEILLSFAITVYPFFTLGVYDYRGKVGCYFIMENYEQYQNWNLAVMGCGELIVPSAIVCVFTALILVKVTQANRTRARLAGGRPSRDNSQQAQLTAVLLAVAIAFVVIRLPYTILFNINAEKTYLWPNLGVWASFWIYASNSVAQWLAVLNYSINFFLYCLCGTTFRNELTRIYRCRRPHHSMAASTIAVTAGTPSSPYHQTRNHVSNYNTPHKSPLLISNSNGLPKYQNGGKHKGCTGTFVGKCPEIKIESLIITEDGIIHQESQNTAC